jgi:hypothetical protein
VGLIVSAPVGRAAPADDATAILDRYVAAIGGAANVERVQSRATHAEMSPAPGVTVRLDTVQARPDRVIDRGEVSGWGWFAKFSRGYDGKVGWQLEPGKPLRHLEGAYLQQLILRFRLDRDAHLNDLYPGRRALADTVIDGRTQRVVQLSTAFGTNEVWSLDATTGLLTRTEVVEERGGAEGRVKVVTTFQDYRLVDGIKLPFRRIVQDGRRRTALTIRSIEDNVAIGEIAPPA